MRKQFTLWRLLLVIGCVALPPALDSGPARAQLTGQRVTVDLRYPTDTRVPSKYGSQIVPAKGAYFLAGPCGIKVTTSQISASLSTLYNKYTFENTVCNGYRLTVSAGTLRQLKGSQTPPLLPISGVAVDPQSHLPGFDGSRITFTSTYVQVNLAGLTFGTGDKLILDLTFGPPPRVVNMMRQGLRHMLLH